MPLSEKEKNYIVDKAVEILRAPDKVQRIAALREKVMSAQDPEGEFSLDDAVYSVLQAIEEIYGK